MDIHQRPRLQGASKWEPPEKIGEVFAGLHDLLVCRILRKILKKKPIKTKYEVNGLLIDEVCGSIRCTLKLDMKEGESNFQLDLADYTGQLLTPGQLWKQIVQSSAKMIVM